MTIKRMQFIASLKLDALVRLISVKFTVSVYELYIILSIFTFLFSFECCEMQVCRLLVYELYFPTQIFNIATTVRQEYFRFYSEFILANIVIFSSNVNCKSCVFVMSPWLVR